MQAMPASPPPAALFQMRDESPLSRYSAMWPQRFNSPGFAASLVVFGIFAMLLPMIGLQFKLLILLGPYQLTAGVFLAFAGTFLLFVQLRFALAIVALLISVSVTTLRLYASHQGIAAITNPTASTGPPPNTNIGSAFKAPPPPDRPLRTVRVTPVPTGPELNWTPDPAVEPQLAAPVTAFGYSLRLPAGFTEKAVGEWVRTDSSFLQPAKLKLTVMPRKVFDLDRPEIMTQPGPASVLFSKQILDLPGGTTELGQIDGIKFTHALYRAKLLESQSLTSLYSGFDNDKWVTVRIFYAGPPTDLPAELEGAARSLKRGTP